MNDRRLVVTPRPRGDESLPGYLLRLSEANGCASPWWLYQIAGLRQSETRSCNPRLTKLSLLVGHDPDLLAAIRFRRDPAGGVWGDLLGHKLLPVDLSLHDAKFCPQCASSTGYINGHWQLALITGCDIHQRRPMRICRSCTRRIRWFRPGLIKCVCGSSLLDQETPALSSNESSLLAILRRKFLGLFPPSPPTGKLPEDLLAQLELHTMLATLQTLGRQRLHADREDSTCDPEALINASARVFIDWPSGFHSLLADIAKCADPTRAYGSLHTFLYKAHALGTTAEAEFLRQAFFAFLDSYSEHHSRARAAIIQSVPKCRFGQRYVCSARIAVKAGVQPVTATRFLKGHSKTIHVKTRRGERLWIDVQDANVTPKSGRVLRIRDAAAYLDVPVSLLRALRQAGVYRAHSVLPSKPGFHTADLDAFAQALTVHAVSRTEGTLVSEPVMLRDVLRNPHDDVQVKLHLIRAILSGTLEPLVADHSQISHLEFRPCNLENVLSSARMAIAGLSARRVATLLECDPACVPGLVQEGYLAARSAAGVLKVSQESVELFRAAWRSLASLAKELKTSSRSLTTICVARAIPMLKIHTGRRGHHQPFVRICDQLLLSPENPASISGALGKRVA